MTLQNTTETDLRNAEIQFEFWGEMLDSWCSRTKVSNIELQELGKKLQEVTGPRIARWKFLQFPSGDSVEFKFQVVEPTQQNYEVALYETNNIVVDRTNEAVVTEAADRKQRLMILLMYTIVILAFVFLLFLFNIGLPPRSR